MSWTVEQQKRLSVERQILATYFPAFTWHNPAEGTYVYGKVQTNVGNRYALVLYVPRDVPNSVPQVVVWEPKPLLGFRGVDLGAMGLSASMHLLSPVDGRACICHYRQSYWTPQITFYKVLVKARLWLEALEAHRRTGEPIDRFLAHQ